MTAHPGTQTAAASAAADITPAEAADITPAEAADITAAAAADITAAAAAAADITPAETVSEQGSKRCSMAATINIMQRDSQHNNTGAQARLPDRPCQMG
jgi:hypothetical protein